MLNLICKSKFPILKDRNLGLELINNKDFINEHHILQKINNNCFGLKEHNMTFHRTKRSISVQNCCNLESQMFRPTGIVGRGADCCTKGTAFEFRVRHGCKTLRPFTGGNGDRQSAAPIIKWPPALALVVGQGLRT